MSNDIIKTDSYRSLESLMDISCKLSSMLGRDHGRTEFYEYNRGLAQPSWYNRVNITDFPEPCADRIQELKNTCTEAGSPKYLTLCAEDGYEGLDADLEAAGFYVLKDQTGMLYDLGEDYRSEASGPGKGSCVSEVSCGNEEGSWSGESCGNEEGSCSEESGQGKGSCGNEASCTSEIDSANEVSSENEENTGRAAEASDCAGASQIIRIGEDRIEEWTAVCEAAFEKSGNLETYRLLVRDPQVHMLAALNEEGRIVATAVLNICRDQENGGIHEVGTLKEYRGRSYATALIRHIIRAGREEGLKLLSLQASVYGYPVYKRLGFREVSHIRNYAITQ